MNMKVLGIFRGFPGLGRVVSGVSLLETLRDQYNCEIEIISYLQGNRYLESKGYKGLREAIPMDYCSIGLLPTNKMGVHINDRIRSFSPDLIIVDGEPLILHSIKISHPTIKVVCLLNPADVDNPHNDKEAMDYFNHLYSLADLAIVHGLRTPIPSYTYNKIISVPTILRAEILNIRNIPSNDIYCILGGGTVNVGYQFESSTVSIANICKNLVNKLPDYNMHIICSSQNIFDALNESKDAVNVILHKDVLSAKDYYSNAALVITRSGRNTLSELAYLGVPALSFVTGDSYRCIEQEQNLNSISAKNISSVNSDIPLEDIYEKALFLITQGQTNNEYKAGNESAIKEILSLISNV